MAANASQRPSRTTVPPTATRQDPAADTTTLPDGSVRPLLDTDEAGGNILRADMVGQGIVHLRLKVACLAIRAAIMIESTCRDRHATTCQMYNFGMQGKTGNNWDAPGK